jgi:cardiolipin synthase
VHQMDWKEVGIQVIGSDIELLRNAYERAWQGKKFRERRFSVRRGLREFIRTRSALLRLNHTFALRFGHYRNFLKRIRRSQKRIWLGNAYFLPHYGVIRALIRASRRGVDVRLLLPHRSDVFFMPWVASTHYYTLIRSGVAVYEYLPTFYHAKVRAVDDWMIVGSSNLNHRSLLHDLEVDVSVTRPENRQALLADMEKDFSRSKRITLTDLKKVSVFKRVFARFMLIFRYWL